MEQGFAEVAREFSAPADQPLHEPLRVPVHEGHRVVLEVRSHQWRVDDRLDDYKLDSGEISAAMSCPTRAAIGMSIVWRNAAQHRHRREAAAARYEFRMLPEPVTQSPGTSISDANASV